MALNFNNIHIDKELEKLLPPLSKEDYNILEQSLLKNGFEQKFGSIKVWFGAECDINNKSIGYIIDGHNRFKICKKHNIELSSQCYEVVFMDTKEEVIKWMYENQLARRNLSSTEKYEIVERYTSFLNEMAKKNQSDGGKGLSNLTKVNVRKEKAKKAGMSDGNYYKLDKIMKSDNEEIKQLLREKKISVDKAYQEIKNPKPKEKESKTPEQKIIEFDDRMNEIDREISSLKSEREILMRRRSSLFESLDIPFTVKYRFSQRKGNPYAWECQFYIEFSDKEEVLYEGNCYFDERPNDVYLKHIPQKYQNDFEMAWSMAHKEAVNENKKYDAKVKEENKKLNEALNDIQEFYNFTRLDKAEYYVRKFHKDLMKIYHPDNIKTGNNEAMQYLNKLKEIWGI